HLLDESERRVLDILKVENRRTAGIDHERNREGIVDRREVRDRLFDAVLVDFKILAPQVGNELSVAANHQDGRVDKRGLDANHVVRVDFLSDSQSGGQPHEEKSQQKTSL